MRNHLRPLALSLALAVSACAAAAGEVVVRDPGFLPSALAGGSAQVGLAELARERAAGADVRALARAVAKDHKRFNERLSAFLRERRMRARPDTGLAGELGRLRKLKGRALDRAYLALVERGHRQAVALYEAESKSMDDLELRVFADRALPSLRGHLRQARALAGKVGRK
jgi:putative membrane protein